MFIKFTSVEREKGEKRRWGVKEVERSFSNNYGLLLGLKTEFEENRLWYYINSFGSLIS